MNPEVKKLLPSDMTAVNIVLVFVAVEVNTGYLVSIDQIQ